MCRYKQLWGFAVAAFGLGLLTGAWLDGGFLCSCLGIGLIVAGVALVKK